ncbi:MAG: hypothetical protein KA015_05765 [Spirochaetes bacterium]|nr:hypothetical protein [Spirochaetota bacterium]
MKNTAVEFLHQPESKNWFELYSINFCDKKNKIYGNAEIEILAKKNKVRFSWQACVDQTEYSEECETDFDGNYNAKKISSPIMKYTIIQPCENFKLELKNSKIKIDLDISGLFSIYDYPLAPDKDGNTERLAFESKMWKRIEQRCKFSGTAEYKSKEKKVVKKIDCFGQREKHWGEKSFDSLKSYSRYMIQLRDMSFSLTCINFGNTVLSSGYMSKKSGNMPIDETELEHIDINKEGLPVISEISYTDSFDEKDLIVSNRIHSFRYKPVTMGKNTFQHFKSFSEYSIVGALKKGIGFEEHFIHSSFMPVICGDK